MRFNLTLTEQAAFAARKPVAQAAAVVPAHIAAEWIGAGKPESAAERVRRVLGQ